MVSFGRLGKFVPRFQAVLNWLVLIFITRIGAVRAGITSGQGLAVVFTLIGFLQRLGVIRKIPFFGKLPELYELGVAFLVHEVLVVKSMSFFDIVPAIRRMVMGNGGGAQQTQQPAMLNAAAYGV